MADIQSQTCLGATWGYKQVWVQTGDIKQIHVESEKREREGATWQHLMGPPQHDSATWQHPIGPPHPYGSHTPDGWVPLMPRGSISLGHVSMPPQPIRLRGWGLIRWTYHSMPPQPN
jgi:hypothetical protein